MLSVQTVTVVLLKRLVGLLRRQAVESKLYAASIVSIGTIDALDGRVAAEYVGTTILILLIDTYYLEGEVAHIYEVADAAFQFLGLLVAQHQNLAAFFHVYLIDEAALQQLHLVNFRVVGIDTADARREVLLTMADGDLCVIMCTLVIDILREFLLGYFHIAFVQTNVAPLL